MLRRTMSTTIAAIQLCCSNDLGANFRKAKQLIEDAAKAGAKVIFMPECTDFIATSRAEACELSSTLDGSVVVDFTSLAKRLNVHLSLCIHEKCPSSNKIFNSHLMISSFGAIQAIYRKTHLFDVDSSLGSVRNESDYVLPGNDIVAPVSTPAGVVGLGICYDVRFPEFSVALRKLGSDIITFPSAFFVKTGQAHWEVLMRARAIENQCYVVSAAQVGQHNDKRTSYGHTIIVDPWGNILSCLEHDEGIVTAEVTPSMTTSVRSNMPVLEQKREDLYLLAESCIPICDDPDSVAFHFAAFPILSGSVFVRTKHAIAFVNLKPVVPGHVLVSPIRCVSRYADLTEYEVFAINSLAKRVGKVLEEVHGCTSLTISLQDGVDAGQTVPHVHIHVLPRKAGDFGSNDDVYTELARHDHDQHRKSRSQSAMSTEALGYRSYFYTT